MSAPILVLFWKANIINDPHITTEMKTHLTKRITLFWLISVTNTGTDTWKQELSKCNVNISKWLNLFLQTNLLDNLAFPNTLQKQGTIRS